jgi:predicted nucleic acid-binding protein
MFSADSSLIVRLYDPLGSEVEKVRKYLDEDAKVLTISELSRLEVINVFLRRSLAEAVAAFESDLKEGRHLRLEVVDWGKAFQQAESLARRFSAILKPGGHDLVLVAAAVTAGASWFLSFERNSCQRPLAAAAGLRVWPPLDKNEKGLVRHAIQKG